MPQARIDGDNLALPFRLYQIPVGSKLARIDQFRIVIDFDPAGIADIDKDILVVRIDIFMGAAPPSAFIHYLGQHQNRLDRIEELADIKRAESGALAAGEKIRDMLSRPPLRYEPRAEIIASAAELADFDFRVSPPKSTNRLLSERSVFKDVNADNTFPLSRRNSFVPLGVPVQLRLRREARTAIPQDEKQQCRYFCSHRFRAIQRRLL